MLQEFKSETEIKNFFDELKKIALKAYEEKRKVEYQHFSSVPPIKGGGQELMGINTLQVNIWDKVPTFEQLDID